MTLDSLKSPPGAPNLPQPAGPTAESINLDALIAPMSVDEFLSKHWRKSIFYSEGSAALAASIQAALGSLDVPTLVAQSTSIDAMPRGGGRKERLSNLSPQHAIQLYEQGYTLYFDLRRAAPNLAQIPNNIAEQLGVFVEQTSCSIFASLQNSGVTTHFDNNENFTVQLRGRKTWKIWSNPELKNPAHCFATGEPLIDPESGMYLPTSVRDTDFHGGETVEMKPGSVLYHHAGSWHTTRADDAESVSLNIYIRPVRFFNLLYGAIQARLFSHPAIRDDLPPQRSDPAREQFARSLTAAIHAAAKVVNEIDPKDALAVCSTPNGFTDQLARVAQVCPTAIKPKTTLRKNSLVAFDQVSDSARVVLQVHVFLGPMSRRFFIEVPDHLEEACLKVTSCNGEFSARQLAGRNEDPADYLEVCAALIALGALRVVSE